MSMNVAVEETFYRELPSARDIALDYIEVVRSGKTYSINGFIKDDRNRIGILRFYRPTYLKGPDGRSVKMLQCPCGEYLPHARYAQRCHIIPRRAVRDAVESWFDGQASSDTGSRKDVLWAISRYHHPRNWVAGCYACNDRREAPTTPPPQRPTPQPQPSSTRAHASAPVATLVTDTAATPSGGAASVAD